MQKNNFCIISNKSLKICEPNNAPSHFLIYKSNEKEINHINQKLKERIFNKYYKRKNKITKNKKEKNVTLNDYILSKKVLMKYNNNYNSMIINHIINQKKCHFCALYNDICMFADIKIDYIKKYYSYNESIKIIPKRQAYFKHLMIYREGPIYKSFIYNSILKRKGLEKLNLYRRANYQKKFNRKTNLNINNNDDSNIIFNSNVIETIENCSTSLTQCSNKKNNIININNKIIPSENALKKNINESIISEIKYNNNVCNNKRNDSNIDKSLLMIMKELAISPNLINTYLYKNNNNYKQLYNKMKSKSKTITIKNRKDKERKLIDKENKNATIQNEFGKEQPPFIKIIENNIMKNMKQKSNKKIRESTSLIKKINNIKIMQFNTNNIKSSSQKDNQNINSCTNFYKYRASLGINRIHLNLNLRNNNKKLSCKDKNSILFHYFNNTNKAQINEKNTEKISNKTKNKFNLNNQIILKSIKKIIEHQRPKNNSLRKYINTQKFLTDSTAYCLLDMNSLNENETKKMIQTINPVKSISISNNQFFNTIKEIGTDVNNKK